MAANRDSRDGYVTIAVLAFVGIFAAIVSAGLAASRPTLGYARLGAQELTVKGLLDAGLSIAAYTLFVAERDLPPSRRIELSVGQGRLRLTVADEAARVDINAADAELLAGLYAAAGCRTLPPQVFAARVIDWRDADGELTDGGAERQHYLAAGLGHGPRNAPFRSTADLRFVFGVPAEEAARLERFVTVFNPEGGIDPLTASETVLLALPDLDPADFALLLRSRRAGTSDRQLLLESLRSPSRFLSSKASGIYRVGITGRLANGFSRSAEAVVVASADPARDFGVLHWAKAEPAGAGEGFR